jgi:hypothetical protein
VREGKKVRQQVFGTLGRLDELKASGQLEGLIRSGLRHCENFSVIDAHAAGETEAVRVLRIGPDLVFGRLWKESGIEQVVHSLVEARHSEFDLERAIYLSVLHRLFASGSDRAAERWRENYLIPGTEALNLHHLYRAMAFLGQEIKPRGPKTLGAARCLKDLIEEELYKALWTVEDIFRTSKAILETRPIYHKRDETIRGHVFCSFLALLLKQELESRMQRADLQWEWKELIRGLDALQQVEASFQDRRFLLRSQLTAHASQAVRASGVALPPTLRELQ